MDELEIIMPSEIGQTQKDDYRVIPLIHGMHRAQDFMEREGRVEIVGHWGVTVCWLSGFCLG